DERAMRVEAARLRRILRVAEAPPVPASASASADEPSPATSVSAAPPEAPALTPESRADDQLLKARLAADQARLSFYVLTKAERDALVTDHRQRQEKNAGARAKQEVSEAELEKERAHAERVRAEKELADARSEAAKLLGAERVRLLEIRESQ